MGRLAKNQRFSEPPISYDGAKWFCVVTNPNCQTRAELELYSLGYRTFVPKVRKWVSHARVKKAVERPLLGRYLFVEVDYPRQSFGAVRSANGVEGIVSNPDPISIPSNWIESMRIRQMQGEWDYVTTEPVVFTNSEGKPETRNNAAIPLGARIRVVEGEFDDFLATVTSRKAGKVSFKILDTNIYRTMHECSVRAA